MSDKVYISGIGVVSAIGENAETNLASLKTGQAGIGPIEFLQSKHKDEFEAGEIKLTNEQLAQKLGLSNAENYPRTALLALMAAREAFHNAGLEQADSNEIGFIGGTTVGGMDKTEQVYLTPHEHPEFILTHSGGYIAEQVARELGVSGYLASINTACSSSANAIITASQLIRHGVADIIIAGGYDCLSKFTINGFKSLLILSPAKCLPFDNNREGLNLGEGAGFVVLESEKSIAQRGRTPLCELTGFANTNDAHHQTASSPNGEGATLSMNGALQISGLSPKEIDYVNVHGTGTENNDWAEAMALSRVFGDKVPAFSSTKSFTGHTLGAAGGIEAVYAIMALQHNLIFPNLRFTTPIEGLEAIRPVTELRKDVEIKHVMSNSFGFGGNNSTLIFSKV